jgi:zinc transport system substrate-binding protein
MKNNIHILLVSAAVVFSLSGCSVKKTSVEKKMPTKITVVTTLFAPFDFVREITRGTDTQVNMLLPPGAEVHSFEPTAQDMIRIQNCSLFIYAGGGGDAWADKLVASLDNKIKSMRMIDCVNLLEEEHKEGMEPDKDDSGKANAVNEKEWDEHVWVSPKNAILIVNKITETLSAIDPKNSAVYQKNAESYTAQLSELDNEFRTVISKAKRTTVIFADRFPARYFTEEFGLSYFAAFPGCSTDTEPSAATVSFIINKVKQEKIPAVFYIELSNQKMADTVCEATGAKKLLFHCCHNLSKDDFNAGATYLSVMKHNVETLKEALN